MKKVLVLMATYNGARYLDEQIQSLIDQKNVELEILVRDDGSTDNTINVLNKWRKIRLVHRKTFKCSIWFL